MDFGYDDRQEELRTAMQAFAREAGLDNEPRSDGAAESLNMDAWRKCAGFGVQGGLIPTELGGKGQDLLTYVAGLEALGETCSDTGLLFSMAAHAFACALPIFRYGTDAQRRRWLPGLCDGSKVGAIAIAEEHGASDAFGLRTRARRVGDHYVLTGHKSWVTNAPCCDLALVFARVETKGEDRTVCLVVEHGTPGMLRRPPTPKMGLCSAPFGDLVFDRCAVPADNMLGTESRGKLIFMYAMEWERGCLPAPIVGVMKRQIDQCVRWVNGRRQRGRPLSRHQAVSDRIANMKVRAELSKLAVYSFAWEMQRRRRAPQRASIVKLHVAEAFLSNSLDAVQIHGAYGYTRGAGLERDVRDAVGLRIASGTSDIQRSIIARCQGLATVDPIAGLRTNGSAGRE